MASGFSGNGNGSGDNFHRHTAYQTQQLEEFYKGCSHPDKALQEQLSAKLGLEPKQIRYWFQNRRTQAKAQQVKAEHQSLKSKYENLKGELREREEENDRLKCLRSTGSLTGTALRNKSINQEEERLARQTLVQQIQPVQPLSGLLDLRLDLQGQGKYSPYKKSEMIEMATGAMDELTKLLENWDPFWVKSPIDRRLVLDVDTYHKNFPRLQHFHNFSRIESSKDSGIVAMSARGLVDMFMDPNKWMDLFPTIIAKARKIDMLVSSTLGDHDGTIVLMHGRLHILSPLVAPRDFYFLRYCKQIGIGRWVVADISCKCSSFDKGVSSLLSWKRPSGCLIQDMLNGSSELTWVEHVEVDSRYQINHLYRDILSGGGAYGAERWLATLKRMVERLQCCSGAIYHQECGANPMNTNGKILMELSHRMVKTFVAMLSLSNDPFMTIQLHDGSHLSVSQRDEEERASGIILGISSAIWLPVPRQTLFDFLRDEKKRPQWDVLSKGNTEGEWVHFSCGINPGNRLSIFRTSAPQTMLLQESCTDELGSLIVYSPIECRALSETVIMGRSSENIFLSPSGFVICDAKKGLISGASTCTAGATSHSRRGSILTVLIQVRTSFRKEEMPYDMVEKTSTISRSIVERIKVAMG